MTLLAPTAADERVGQRPAVRVRSVSHRFDPHSPAVLEDVNFQVGQGEFVCLLGASGCGKSTLLNLVSGLDTPVSGSIERADDAVALMFQESALLPWLTAAQNVELALRLRGVGRRDRAVRARELLGTVRLAEHADRRPHEMSGGMRQRVAMARALAQEARLLLLDEPFAALDAITRDALHIELRRLWRENSLSVVFVTHNVREAVRLGQRVLLLSSRPGRVVAEYTVDIPAPRRIEDERVGALAAEITERLEAEIRRHGH
jgi:NitT/TauT family transport system ATP-binding protein